MAGFLQPFAEGLSFVLNILQAITILITVTTFLVMMFNRFAKALRTILKPCGLPFLRSIHIMFLCRKTPDKKRAFLEFAILKTKGRPTDAEEWKHIVNEFKNFYSEAEQHPVYEVPNCTVLLNEDLQDAATRYFAYFEDEAVRKTFGIKANAENEEPMEWVVRICVNESYLTPTCLLTGLLSDKEDNWTEFVKRYVSTGYISDSAESDKDDILTEELYLTFAWLLWGPSLELRYKDYWAGLCQISFGDESNSIPAVASSDVVGQFGIPMSQKVMNLLSVDENRSYGVLLNTTLSVHENKPFYKKLRDKVKPEEAYFYEKIEDGDCPMAFCIEDARRHTGYRSEKYYCTAYVWLLFELVTEEDDAFHPERTLAFFEHANLADMGTYDFLVGTLLDKSVKHFKDIFADEQYRDRKYRFVCALNEDITIKCMEMYEKLMETDKDFAERMIMTPKRLPAEVFADYDAFFSKDTTLTFEEVTLKDKSTIRDLGNFYTEIYMEAFPDENERETFDNLLYYLKSAEESKDDKAYRYHIVLAKDENDNIIAGSIFDYFAKTNAGVVEFIAVNESLQSSGVGTKMFKHVKKMMNLDADKLKKRPVDYIFCEVDQPAKSRAAVKKYLYFWRKNQYKHIDFTYVQPALNKEKDAVDALWLTVACVNDFLAETIPAKVVIDFVADYMKYAMQIDEPEAMPEFKAMQEELLQKGNVALKEIEVQ